jgi:hypothetical protein
MTTAIFNTSEIAVGDTVYMTDVWSGKQWGREVVAVTKATISIDDFGTTRKFTRREDTFWNRDDYIMVAA